MATATRPKSAASVLYHVPYRYYVRLNDDPANCHLKMAYHNGTLEIVSPRIEKHEVPSRRLSLFVPVVARHLGFRYHGTRSGTFRRGGPGPYEGSGKEPDESFYIQNAGRVPMSRDLDLGAGDPPPDLWIEVDNRVSSARRFPIYAALGVPEVWRYRSRRKTLQFFRLADGAYEPIEHSLALPPLTPALVLEALALGDNLIESEWETLLRDWVARTIPIPEANA